MVSIEETVAEPLEFAAYEIGTMSPLLADNVEVAQTDSYYVYSAPIIEELIQWFTTTSQALTWHTTLTQKIGLSVRFLKVYDSVTMTQAMAIGQTDEYYAYAVRELADAFEIEQVEAYGLIYTAALTQAIRLRERQKLSDVVTLTQTFSVTDLPRLFQFIDIVEGLGFTDAVLMPWKVYSTVAEQLEMADALARYLGGSLADVVAVIETLARRRNIMPTVAESVTVVDTPERGLLLRVDAEDSIEITPEQALSMLFKPTLTDAIEIVSAYLDPEGITTWAVNLSHGGVTEYTNYNFNSFAQLGNKYIAACEDGLYELDGDDDDGTDIIARLKSGMLQFGKSNYSSFKGIYIGIRGGGDVVLKLETGDGKTYTYSVEARTMSTTKVNVGKGLRARYFSYELISTGQDFDLDSIEFLPLVARRRV